jgi:hypothetical protein
MGNRGHEIGLRCTWQGGANWPHCVSHEDGAAIVRRIMLRLTQLGEGTEDTRRRAAIDEIMTTSSEADAVECVVKAMADARLLTTT